MIFNIQKFSIHDGPGIRTTVFLKGCPLRCRWCANPESQSGTVSMLYDERKCIGCRKCISSCPEGALHWDEENQKTVRDPEACSRCGKCETVCPVKAWKAEGERRNLEDVVQVCLQDRDFYLESGGGVTISGGEGMMQPEFAGVLADALKKEKIHTAIETTGCVSGHVFHDLAPRFDLLLFDVKHWDPAAHKNGTGTGNEQILENLKWAVAQNLQILCRIPVIPGFNDSLKDAEMFARLFESLKIPRVQLLCFHQMGERKYEMMDRSYEYTGVKAYHEEDLQQHLQIYKEHGIEAWI